MGATGFAVFDLETTGLHPSYGHRVIEIGIVLLDSSGNEEGRWSTLINPKRDLGRSDIHGIRGADIGQAGTFADYAPEILKLMRNRVLVAHNARFDLGFIQSEFEKIGVQFPVHSADDMICTMSLGSSVLPGKPRSLAACAEAVGLFNDDAHAALADAEVTANLFKIILDSCMSRSTIDAILEMGEATQWLELQQSEVAAWPRGTAHSVQRGVLAGPASQAQPVVFSQAENSFIALLETVLADGIVTVEESQELLNAAAGLGLSPSRLQELREEYFDRLVARAWGDGVMTPDEVNAVTMVGAWMGINADRVEAAIQAKPEVSENSVMGVQLVEGDSVVLTGEMSRPRSYYEDILQSRGLRVAASVSKKVKVVLVADPDSLSGKANKARELGIPLIEIEQFLLQAA
ncbi:MAG: hypothetical protein RLZZ600_1164 [Actinomycetota bacterium]